LLGGFDHEFASDISIGVSVRNLRRLWLCSLWLVVPGCLVLLLFVLCLVLLALLEDWCCLYRIFDQVVWLYFSPREFARVVLLWHWRSDCFGVDFANYVFMLAMMVQPLPVAPVRLRYGFRVSGSQRWRGPAGR